jgi:hypothetical protein
VTPSGEVTVSISKPHEDGVGTAVVDGNPVCLPGSQDCASAEAKDGQVRPQIAVAPIVLWAVRAYATWDFFKGCARPFWNDFRARGISGITQATTDNCVLSGASDAAGGVLGSYMRGVGVTRLRGAIKDSVGRRITWNQLRTAMNKGNFRDVVGVVAELSKQFFQQVYDGIYEAIQRL